MAHGNDPTVGADDSAARTPVTKTTRPGEWQTATKTRPAFPLGGKVARPVKAVTDEGATIAKGG